MPDEFKLSPERELDRILSLEEAEQVSSLSRWSWLRNHQDKIVTLSPRRKGVRLRDALMMVGPIPTTKKPKAARA
jgi:hypothetical protein